MIKSTKIIAVDSKGGRRSRTGSFVSMGVTDREAIECQDYFLDLADGEEPTGRVKKIELVIYYEDDMKEQEYDIHIDSPKDAITSSNKPLIEDVIIQQDEAPKLKSLKCECGKTYEWANVYYGDEYSNIEYKCSCGCTTIGGKELTAMVLLWAGVQNNTSKLKFFIENVLEEEFHETPKEHLPPNQVGLDIFEEDKPAHKRVYDENGDAIPMSQRL